MYLSCGNGSALKMKLRSWADEKRRCLTAYRLKFQFQKSWSQMMQSDLVAHARASVAVAAVEVVSQATKYGYSCDADE